jgi:hypothetical protein
MRRFLFSFRMAVTVATAASTGAAMMIAVSSCSGSSVAGERSYVETDASHRDGSIVEPVDGGSADAPAPPGPEPECETYCDSVLDSCKGSQAQYTSRDECLAFCANLPPGKAGENEGNSIACRLFYAGSPARTDSVRFCGAAGPFGGGGICGDRCPIFCELAVSACAPAGGAPYASYSDCQTACLDFDYQKPDVDGGGEPPHGPISGNTLNCRLFYLREAVMAGTGCENLGVNSAACK